MEDRDPIPDVSYHHVYLHQIECNDMIKNHKKNKQNFYIVYQVRIRYSRSVCFKFHIYIQSF